MKRAQIIGSSVSEALVEELSGLSRISKILASGFGREQALKPLVRMQHSTPQANEAAGLELGMPMSSFPILKHTWERESGRTATIIFCTNMSPRNNDIYFGLTNFHTSDHVRHPCARVLFFKSVEIPLFETCVLTFGQHHHKIILLTCSSFHRLLLMLLTYAILPFTAL